MCRSFRIQVWGQQIFLKKFLLTGPKCPRNLSTKGQSGTTFLLNVSNYQTAFQ